MQKHVVNDPTNVVSESLKGLVRSDPALVLDVESRVIHLAQQDPYKVALVSGGGAGHEPAHAGWVTPGVLTGAITGNVFASPNVKQIKRGIQLVNKSAGTLIIVKNYTGDVLHFGLAKEQHAASGKTATSGPVRFVIVGDDCAVPRSQSKLVGRRGLAGTTLVYKIAGALASRGATIDQVEEAAKLVASRIGTIGVGLGHCHVPGTESGAEGLSADEAEVGMGIHNEPGFSRVSPIPKSSELIAKMLTLLTSTTDPERSFLPLKLDGSDEVVLVVNNLGGLSELELGGVTAEACTWLEEKANIKIKKVLSGTFMTSLNMPGFSLTLLLLPRADEDLALTSDELLTLLSEKDPGSKWRWGAERTTMSTIGEMTSAAKQAVGGVTASLGLQTTVASEGTTAAGGYVPLSYDSELFQSIIKSGCESVIEAEPLITHYDTVAGDGDCGLTLKAGAESILGLLKSGKLTGKDPVAAVILVAEEIEESMGGTSGALYSIFLHGIATGLRNLALSDNGTLDGAGWSHALDSALRALYNYTRARPPSRTLVDPLDAFIRTFHDRPADFDGALQAAHAAAEATKKLKATAGRAAYVAQEELGSADVPDPGAWGVWRILDGMGKVLGA